MTAQLLDRPLARSASGTIPTRSVPTRRGEPVGPARRASRQPAFGRQVSGHSSARACAAVGAQTAAVRPVRPVAGGGRLYWTARGLAVLVSLVLLVAGVMLATVVGAFLAVSNEPLDAAAPAAAVVMAAPVG